ncbi:MAG: ABC transporter permease [Methanomassiliicoccaceae archaeon]|nr:ABC transporter permease [Methanomassiliicoccaceae archaeon]
MTFDRPGEEERTDPADTVVDVAEEIDTVDIDDDTYDNYDEDMHIDDADRTDAVNANAGGEIVDADVVYTPLSADTERIGKRYRLPSQIRQMSSVYAVQMRQYAKNAKTFLFILLAALIFIIPFVVESLYPNSFADLEISFLLFLLPYMMAFIPVMFAGKVLSSEFRDKTAYMVFPLPISRTAFYTGKFLAALTLSFGVILLGFGIAIFTADIYGIYIPDSMPASLALAMCGVFAIAAMAYMLSTLLKKGSVGVMMVIMFVLPVILAGGWVFFLDYMMGEGYIDLQTEETMIRTLMFLPIFAYAPAMIQMGVGMDGLPPLTFYTMGLDPGFANVLLFEPLNFAVVSVITGIVFLIIGLIRINRKEL